jgi:hypothetical protein
MDLGLSKAGPRLTGRFSGTRRVLATKMPGWSAYPNRPPETWFVSHLTDVGRAASPGVVLNRTVATGLTAARRGLNTHGPGYNPRRIRSGALWRW